MKKRKLVDVMSFNLFVRIIFLPVGLLIKLYQLAVEGTRDINNQLRFKNAIIERRCCINPASQIAENCHILENCLILNSTINRFSYIGRNSIIQNTTIGSFCSIANDVFIGLGTHPTNLFSTSPLFYRTSNPLKIKLIRKDYNFTEYELITIGSDVWVGARAIILDGISIGDGAVVAAGSVVTKDIPPYAIVAGVPAKIVKHRFNEKKIMQLLQEKWWTWDLQDIKKNKKVLNSL